MLMVRSVGGFSQWDTFEFPWRVELSSQERQSGFGPYRLKGQFLRKNHPITENTLIKVVTELAQRPTERFAEFVAPAVL
jgi:hypothetical protein